MPIYTIEMICQFFKEQGQETWEQINFMRDVKLSIGETTITQNLLYKFWRQARFNRLPVKLYQALAENVTGMDNVSFYTFRGLENEMLAFINAYHVETVISTAMPPMQLKSKGKRRCRFCKSGPNGALFKNKVHLLPELLGNRTLFSDSECDACNKHFAKYENDLAYSLGMLRTFVGTIGKEKMPVFKSPGEIITARPEDIYGSKTAKISRKNVTDKSIKLDAEKGLVEISNVKNSYRPLHVYKGLLKIALAIMPEESLKAYDKTIQYLLLKIGMS